METYKELRYSKLYPNLLPSYLANIAPVIPSKSDGYGLTNKLPQQPQLGIGIGLVCQGVVLRRDKLSLMIHHKSNFKTQKKKKKQRNESHGQ